MTLKRLFRPRTCAVVLALLSPVLLLTGCGGDTSGAAPAATAAQPALSVELLAPTPQALATEVAASGSVAARELVELGSELSGVRIASVEVEVGDPVSPGDVLVRLDLRTVEAELKQAEAQVMEAQAMLDMASTALERGKALRPRGLISQNDADQLTANHSQARARLVSARAVRDSAALRRDFGTVRATCAGVVAERLAEPGQLAMAGVPLLKIIRNAELEWRAEVTERDLLAIAPGMAVRVLAPDGSAVDATVRQIAPSLDPQTRRGLVYVQLPTTLDSPLRAGMFATGQIQTGAREGLTVPMHAVVMRDGRAHVFLVNDGRAVQRVVELGAVRADLAEIRSGLAANERIVGTGAGFLSDGDRVQVVEPAPTSVATAGSAP